MGKHPKKSQPATYSVKRSNIPSSTCSVNKTIPSSQLLTDQSTTIFSEGSMTRLSLKISLIVLLCIAVRMIYSQTKSSMVTPGTSNNDSTTYETVTVSGKQSHLDEIHGSDDREIRPSVYVGILVRNKAHSLPYFLRGLEMQAYPTDRIALHFVCDNSIDNSVFVLDHWIDAVRDKYHQVTMDVGGDELEQTTMWSKEHYEHVIQRRQYLLNSSRLSWADFYFSIDADVILMNPNTLDRLVNISLKPVEVDSGQAVDMSVVAPLINCTTSEYYSNFWGAMTEEGYYKRSQNYFSIQRRQTIGIYPVAMVHSVYLVNLRHRITQKLANYPAPEDYAGPLDDLIIFARSAQAARVTFYLDNTRFYGYLPSPVEEGDMDGHGTFVEQWLRREQELFVHLRLQALLDHEDRMRVLPSKHLELLAEAQLPTPSKLGFDEVYFINLLRRSDRRAKMEYFLDQLGIAARHVTAVDGKNLNVDLIANMGIKQLKGYADPYHKRSLKFGEIGCFLSHFYLWQEMIEHGYQRILILEDDVRFAPAFVRNLAELIAEADTHVPEWDLIYVGRKRMSKNETRVPHTTRLAYPDYTYWTLGYVLKRKGAEKLLAQEPLKKLVAVDEYLPIMFNRHPQRDWLEQFEPRNLIALSAEPLLVEPQRYTGEQYYVSDTEDSEVLGSF
ncbi:Collagen beta-1 O-galactosyltransferase [Paragonimus heterotremus]|uniref:Collagen beta-1 O-galactosyltransferase n=1 Tax=Paragonimus heterotremus TaxID=100268 RepID=A0A8J4TIC3_9TREM|nr:Collagen beta-1 O-galactosyltransferase [Paragonimus heterotremus]